MSAERVRIYNHFPLEFGGGGEASLSCVASGIARTGISVEYVTDRNYDGSTRISRSETAAGIRDFVYVREPFKSYASPGLRWLYRDLPPVEQMAEDSVNLLAIDRVPPVSFFQDLRRRRVRLALLLHGLSPVDTAPGSLILKSYQIYVRESLRLLGRRGALSGCWFQVFNSATASFVRSLGVLSERILTIPTGVDPDKFGPSIESPRFTVLFVGRTERLTKGIDILVRVIRKVEHQTDGRIQFQIIGSGSGSGVLRGVRSIPGVSIEGFVTESRKRELLAGAHAILITSRVEPFSLVAVEALVSGAMVITTSVSGPKGIVNAHPAFGTVCPPNVGAISNSVVNSFSSWLADPAGFSALRRTRVEEGCAIFHREKMIHGYLELIKRIAST